MGKRSLNTRFIKRKCPKCGGNLYHSIDSYMEGDLVGFYGHESCLQCGYDCSDNDDHAIEAVVSTNATKRELLSE